MSLFQRVDEKLLTVINRDLANPVFDAVFPNVTDLHRTMGFQIIALSLLIYAALRIYQKRGLWIVLGLFSSLTLTDGLGSWAKNWWQRPRPFENFELQVIERSGTGSFSFPSNHAANMFCLAFFLTFFFPKQAWMFFIYAILVSISRIYNGVHYPSDVLAGCVLGSLIGVVGAKLVLQIIQKKKNPERA